MSVLLKMPSLCRLVRGNADLKVLRRTKIWKLAGQQFSLSQAERVMLRDA